MSEYLFYDGEQRAVPAQETGIEVYTSLKLDELVRFCRERGIELSRVEISSAGDPFLPTPITWITM